MANGSVGMGVEAVVVNLCFHQFDAHFEFDHFDPHLMNFDSHLEFDFYFDEDYYWCRYHHCYCCWSAYQTYYCCHFVGVDQQSDQIHL